VSYFALRPRPAGRFGMVLP